MTDQGPRFMHFSDAHIGHRQYGLKKRRDDMYMTFRTAILDAIDLDADFTVFSGDLFHNKNVNARALSDAEKGLEELYNEDIPVVAIQGNHDANLYKEDLSWLEYLHSREKIILLEANLRDEGSIFEAHDFDDPGTSSGFVDLDGVRIFGMQYLGQGTENYIDDVAMAIRQVNEENGEPDQTILLGHFGIEGHIPGMSGGIQFSKLEELEGVVDYLGLGHLHKQYSHGDWVFNPGSLEAHNTREAQWEHGYYIVDISEDDFKIEFHNSKRRPFFHIDFTVDEHDTPEELINGFEQVIDEELPSLESKQSKSRYQAGDEVRDPVVDLHLSGLLQFSRSQLDTDALRDLLEQKTGSLYVNINDATESKETASILRELDEGEGEIRTEDGQIDQSKLELAVFRRLTNQDSRYAEKEEEVAETVSVVKQSVLSGEAPESVAETIKKRRRSYFPDHGGEDQ